MNIENPAALHFIMQDDLFFLKADKIRYSEPKPSAVEAVVEEPFVALVAEIPSVTVVADTKPDFKYLGNKKKDFLILVHYPDQEFIHETHLTALENILKRKGFEIDDVAILNVAKHDAVKFEELTNHLKPQKMLVLGESALPQGIVPLMLNMPQHMAGLAMLYSFSFDEMMDNNDYKKAFWEQMKGL